MPLPAPSPMPLPALSISPALREHVDKMVKKKPRHKHQGLSMDARTFKTIPSLLQVLAIPEVVLYVEERIGSEACIVDAAVTTTLPSESSPMQHLLFGVRPHVAMRYAAGAAQLLFVAPESLVRNLLFVAPESLVRDVPLLRWACARRGCTTIAVDEAHLALPEPVGVQRLHAEAGHVVRGQIPDVEDQDDPGLAMQEKKGYVQQL
eukprot:jgi/Chrpa1/330/Chrysochromulina_OHIO_Genome00004767-RA